MQMWRAPCSNEAQTSAVVAQRRSSSLHAQPNVPGCVLHASIGVDAGDVAGSLLDGVVVVGVDDGRQTR
jgi:hypothetical protein